MENSSDSDPCQSFQLPPRRRRSTFFVARESLAPQPQTENIDPRTSLDLTDLDTYNQELIRYDSELLSEKEEWKKENKYRRHKYRDLRQQLELVNSAPSKYRITSSYVSLSNEDIEFLKQKPNISEFLELQQKLHNSVKKNIAFYRLRTERDNYVLSHCETLIKQVKEHIFENSII